jgi:hypothetical protein
VIEESTAESLAAVLRDLVRGSRGAAPTLGPDALPSSLAGLLGVLAGLGVPAR